MRCDLCLRGTNDHHPKCPDRKILMTCPNCGAELDYGDTHYPRFAVCENCISEFAEEIIKEEEEYERE